jgi:hypothetical protein
MICQLPALFSSSGIAILIDERLPFPTVYPPKTKFCWKLTFDFEKKNDYNRHIALFSVFFVMNPPAGSLKSQQTHETHQTLLPVQSFQTPPSQTYVPGQHNYSPYPKSSPFKNLHSSPCFGASAPPTPVKGLTTQEVKSMSKVWNSPAKFVEVVIAAISVYTGISVDEGQVTDILKALLELTVSTVRGLWV